MALDHLIGLARDEFGIQKPQDWQYIYPHQILKVSGCGPSTLNHIRLYLAARGITLRDDATPTFWQEHLQTAKIGGQVSLVDERVTEAFTILVDSAEKQPWMFQGFKDQGKPMLIPVQWKSLGPTHGDYSIKGFERTIHVERKSMTDAHGTFLAAPDSDRGIRWRKTLEFLAEILHGAVVVECSFADLIGNIEARGTRPLPVLQRTLQRQIIAWQMDLRIPFIFALDRRHAEASTYYFLKRAWRMEVELHQRTKPKETPNDIIDSVCS